MTKHFCDDCGGPVTSTRTDAETKIDDRKSFRLSTVFELVEKPSPCGSIGLSSDRVSSADICNGCMCALLNKLIHTLVEKYEGGD